VAAVGVVVGIGLSAVAGAATLATVAMAVLGLAIGFAYDLRLKVDGTVESLAEHTSCVILDAFNELALLRLKLDVLLPENEDRYPASTSYVPFLLGR
jgi:hypothetical protein